MKNLFLDDLPRKRPPHIYKPPTAEMLAYLDFSVSTTGMLTGVKVHCSYKSSILSDFILQKTMSYIDFCIHVLTFEDLELVCIWLLLN